MSLTVSDVIDVSETCSVHCVTVTGDGPERQIWWAQCGHCDDEEPFVGAPLPEWDRDAAVAWAEEHRCKGSDRE